MLTVLELSTLRVPSRSPDLSGTVVRHPQTRTQTRALARTQRTVEAETTWLTATIRPVGTFGRHDTSRLRALLDALSAFASIVVLDMQAARLHSPCAGDVIENAACDIELRGGCLMCINLDAESRACLTAAGDHTVLMDDQAEQGFLSGAHDRVTAQLEGLRR